MIRNFKVVLLGLLIGTIALPSSAMIQQSIGRQLQKPVQKPVRGEAQRPVQPSSNEIKPVTKSSSVKPGTQVGTGLMRKSGTKTPTATPNSVPSININYPDYGGTVHDTFTVNGSLSTAPNGKVPTVTVNGVSATIFESHFEATVSGLAQGPGELVIVVTDDKGNSVTLVYPIVVDNSIPVWVNVGPEAVNLISLVVDPVNSQILYGSCVEFGVIKSTNGGKDWIKTPNRIFGALSIDPNNSSTLYISGKYTDYKSVDAGATWTLLSISGFVDEVLPILIDPFDSNHLILASSDDAPVQSLDGGLTWQRMVGLPRSQRSRVVFDPFNNGTMYYGGTQILKSIDKGITWQIVNPDVSLNGTREVTAFYADPVNAGVIYARTGSTDILKTADGGDHWALVSWPALGAAGGDTSGDLVFDKTQSGVINIAATGRGIFRTVDNGDNWEKIINGIPDTASTVTGLISPRSGPLVRIVVTDPSSSQTLYATTTDGIFKSTDAGASWNSINKDLFAVDVTALATSKSNPDEIIVGTANGLLYKSVDAAQTWTRIDPKINPIGVITRLVIDPKNPDVIYAGAFKSTDGGKSWVFMIQLTNGPVLTIDPVNTNILYAGDDDGYLNKSSDGGLTWKTVFTAPDYPTDIYFKWTQPRISSIAVDPLNPSIVYAGTQRSIYKSTNGGLTWTAVYEAESSTDGMGSVPCSIAIDPLHTNMVYAVTSEYLLSSQSSGATWSKDFLNRQGSSPNKTLTIDPKATSSFFLDNLGSSYFSPDRGQTWKPLLLDFATQPISHIAISYSNPSVVYGGAENGSVSKLVYAVPKPRIATGDVNRDGMVNVADLSALAEGLAGNVIIDNPAADVNHDGKIDVSDLLRLANFLAGNITLQ